jgi:hypothetical protein
MIFRASIAWIALLVAATQSPPAEPAPVASEIAPDVVGDGVHDDTEGLQAMLDSGAAVVRFPAPPVCLSIGRTLKIHSRQMLILDPTTVIRLRDHSDTIMVANADPERGNEHLTLVGGIWDMNNLDQSPTDYQQRKEQRTQYDPEHYLGVLMRFHRVEHLRIRSLVLKDPVTFGMQLGDVRQFTIEDITFNYNLKRTNMDGVHVHGNSRWGRIANLKGTTNDDLVALNADDGAPFEMSRGPIEDISVDGVFSENGYTAVRLLSAGSPVRRVQLSNIFGTYRYNVVSLTNHAVHPGTASTFEDISIRGVFCSKSGMNMEFDPTQPGRSSLAMIWIDAPAQVSNLTISDYHRTEAVWPAENIVVEGGATVESLQLSNFSVLNRTPGPMSVLTNKGTIGCLGMANVYAKAGEGPPRGTIIHNEGTIGQEQSPQAFGVNLATPSGQ